MLDTTYSVPISISNADHSGGMPDKRLFVYHRVMHAGHLKDLNSEQRERVLAFLLEKLHILQGKDTSILGLARLGSQEILLPNLSPPSPPAAIPGAATSLNPITAALDPDGIHAPGKMPITPPPKTIMPFWGGYNAGVVLHQRGTSEAPPCVVSAGTQTADPELESADRLLDKVMQDVRPWGTRARSHPAIVQPRGRKAPAGAAAAKAPGAVAPTRAGTAARSAAVATPQGMLPKFSRGAAALRSPGSSGDAGGRKEGLWSRGEGGVGSEVPGDQSGGRGNVRDDGSERTGGLPLSSRSGRASSLASHFVSVTPPPPSLQTGERSGRSILDSVDGRSQL